MSINQKFMEFQKKTSQQDWDLNYLAVGLGGECGETLNEIKKITRDDGGILSEERKEKIKKELGDILWYLTGIASKLEISLDEIIEANMDKLEN